MILTLNTGGLQGRRTVKAHQGRLLSGPRGCSSGIRITP